MVLKIVYYRQESIVKGNSLTNCLDNYVVVDIETIGLDAVKDEIIEISAVKYRMNRRVDEFITLVSKIKTALCSVLSVAAGAEGSAHNNRSIAAKTFCR